MNIFRYFLKAFFSIVFQGAEKSAYPLTCKAQGGIFSETGGGDFIANLSFYIILVNAVKISVCTIYPEIQTDFAHIRIRIFSGDLLLHPLKMKSHK